ncbi:FdtA/QdtA family cupin domain-containing protein [Carboxylicivirga sp. A043]|uniref:sugar 3,4-ketoisomerase n=1 Tax=Carboxylicivirga litoralis TaxID=2816963 RepID=UPI0021CB72F3|nr:FdtA/QdtA family cupin domain-containing protein [Carboxylicivirga sp. A043]MCU4156568.1 FdtA/QdtA family cupin domain-containing protein [Carboxylicivirga sp. A043]
MVNLNSYYQLITLPKVTDSRGNLTFMEGNKQVPFEVKRVYYIYDVPENKTRGYHSHYDQHQFLIAINGSFEVVLDTGREQCRIIVDNPNIGLHIKPGIWHVMENFSKGCLLLALSSHEYDESDYIRDYNQYLKEQTML